MILIGLGSNLPHPEIGDSASVLREALAVLPAKGVSVQRVSPFIASEPVPVSDQPWYQNAVCAVESTLSASDLLEALHDIESKFGRVRGVRNAARILDLDLLVYHDLRDPVGPPILPHPRMFERDFVMKPLASITDADALRAQFEG
ncbi:MAG: 2-amino-4-hydroxy-6-hydroxymethyldihydropteridine diphosphokinase [Kiloniella sp.]|nr:2-amino-4-hydroxy-6-hydroxymethyldihydropteridine diphosphokinase [Kiloniella sp.]